MAVNWTYLSNLVYLVAIVLMAVGGFREFLSKSPSKRETNKALFSVGFTTASVIFLLNVVVAVRTALARRAAVNQAYFAY